MIPVAIVVKPLIAPAVANPASEPFNKFVLSKNPITAVDASIMSPNISGEKELTAKDSKDACKVFVFASIESKYAPNFSSAVPAELAAVSMY